RLASPRRVRHDPDGPGRPAHRDPCFRTMPLTPSVADAERLLKLARGAKLKRSPVTPPIGPVARGGALSLSFSQQRLWFLEQLGTAGGAYHVHTRLHLRGDLDREALVR